MTPIDKFFSDHFSIPDKKLIPLELINSDRDRTRKAREEFLISKFGKKILEPYETNRRVEI